MNLAREMFDYDPRVGTELILRRPPRLMLRSRYWGFSSSVRVMVTSLEPLQGVPRELTRCWRNGRGELVIHNRKLRQ